ncbi:hypothetical protein [Prevotella sp.]|uniref:hypothetical protein n=1 Tax=Prevotella sp. TaxID=59823 RepID=UPI003079F1E9
MKRVFISAIAALLCIGASAQSDLTTFQVVDKDGNVVADGATLELSEIENMGSYIQIPTGLSVKNTTGTDQAIGIDINLSKIDNGNFSCCFPSSCTDVSKAGEYEDYNAPGILEAGETKEILTEWIPQTYGKCTATLQFKVYTIVEQELFGVKIPEPGEFKAYAQKITVNFEYKDPAGINDLSSDNNAKVVSRYNANGTRVSSDFKGLAIEKLSNGKTIKRIIK